MALLKTLARLDKLIWTLIFGGLLSVALGLSITQRGSALGQWFILGGLLVAACGAGLIYLRSRMSPASDEPPPKS